MADNTVKGSRKITSTGSAFNALSFLIDKKIGTINTAIPVRVVSVNAAEWTISALPLITQRDGFGNALAPSVIPRLPYSRIQGGRAAIIIDPVPGDIGLAVFAQSDCSNVGREQAEPVTPGSFRSFDMSDGFYIGGFLNGEPEIYLEMTQDGAATLHAPARVIIETGDVSIQASGTVSVECESASVNADTAALTASGAVSVRAETASLTASGAVSVQAETAEITANDSAKIKAHTAEVEAEEEITLNAPKITAEGILTAQEVIAAGVSLSTHQHGVAGNYTTPPIATAPAE